MDELTGLRILATRPLATRFLPDPTTQTLHIYVGRLPDYMSVKIPIPDGSDMIGSAGGDPREPANAAHPPRTAILFDTDMRPHEVRDFYRERLLAAGWTMPDYPRQPAGGFGEGEGPDPDAVRELFCYSPRGPALWLNAHRTEGPTNAWLDLEMGTQHSPCAPRRQDEVGPAGQRGRIPPLVLPPGGRHLPLWGGASSGPDATYVTAGVETTLELSDLVAHYTAQIEKGGWTRRDAGQDGALAWSTWMFRDEVGDAWNGALYVTRRPDAPGQYMLQVRAEWTQQAQA